MANKFRIGDQVRCKFDDCSNNALREGETYTVMALSLNGVFLEDVDAGEGPWATSRFELDAVAEPKTFYVINNDYQEVYGPYSEAEAEDNATSWAKFDGTACLIVKAIKSFTAEREIKIETL